ncbi:TIGR03083 family protein [Streptomyces sp. LamerLS-316]|uniref:maleylpyruvate isomerase family mycothiol-dependent enzyme n=1 Tax=unclassified Streptomyces TaxID=2593676 RepID=UPI000823BC3D|nr:MULTISPECIES: maleylpyruvate isomerase family mycothiol-dependent enzyme [unclassified Streptomyces]MYQ43312.1 maleylpyruvate isomerase family mycothiol-dependent enzyme [Streptomyces sp. SID4921]SCK19892.1 TIGR03083 family protein [Streptomyces sp. LamerLS-316]
MATTTSSARAVPRTSGTRARLVNEAELRATISTYRELSDEDWRRPTACTGWTVRDMLAHTVGQYEEVPRPWVAVRRIRRASRTHPHLGPLDGHNEIQIEDRKAVPGRELIGALAHFAPQALIALRRVPAPVRRGVRLSLLYPEAKALPDDSVDYLGNVLAARDTWMHRVDLCDALGAGLVLDGHDREIVDQVVLDLALSWTGPAVEIDLHGPAGGRRLIGIGSPAATLHAEAVDFARHVSGRPVRGSLELEGDPGARAALMAARVVF